MLTFGLLCFVNLNAQVEINFKTQIDTVISWESSIISQTDFVVNDTILYNENGTEDFELSEWYCIAQKELIGDAPVVMSYFQFKILGTGVRYLRTMDLLFEPKWIIERKIIN